MSCRRFRRDISDSLDGALSARRRRRLDEHLGSCTACRSVERDFLRLQDRAGSGRETAFTPERGEEFLVRLRRRLDREPRPSPAVAMPLGKRWWAWGSAGATAAAAVLLAWLFVLRPLPRAEIYLLSESDAFSGIALEVAQDPELELALDDILQSSIVESLRGGEEELNFDLFENPLLSEGLSDEEMRILGESDANEAPARRRE